MEAEDVCSSFLATTVHLPEDLELSSRDHDAAKAVSDGLRDAKAANTRLVYQTAWHLFCEWTLLTGRQSMPTEPGTVALYLGHLAAEGMGDATIAQARAAISHAHAAQGILKGDNPARHPAGAKILKGWRNQAPAAKQADALTTDALARIRETARLPRRGRGSRTETTAMAQARVTVDLAIIGVMADAGLRRSEAAAPTWTDIEFWPEGTARITIRKGKNQPATVAVTEHTARALREIRPDDVDPTSPVFGLTGEALTNRVRASARAAGLGDGFSGHSGRIGMARRMVAARAPNAAVQRQGRWKHGDMVAHYTRECRQFKNIGLQASVSVIPAKAGTRNPVAGKYAFAANGLWIPAFAGMTVNMTPLPGSQLNCCSWAMISSLSARSDAEVFPMYSH